MALLGRLKERTETDLSDDELQRILDEASAAVIARHGPYRDTDEPLTVELTGGGVLIDLIRPLDASEDIEVTEYLAGIAGETSTVLAADDYLIAHGGRTLLRRPAGTNPRSLWGARVALAYVPVDDTAQRDEAVVKLAILSIEYDATEGRRIGDHQESSVDYLRERERILASIQPRPGLLMR